MTNVTRKTSLTDAQVRELRTKHDAARTYALATPEDYETPHATDTRLAADYGLTVAAVAHLAMGLNRPDAGGPIDRIRAAEWLQYRADCKETTEATARRIRAWRKDSRNHAALPLTIAVTGPHGDVTHELQVPGGSAVTITSANVTETRTDATDTEVQA